ncbi:C-type lectin domain family 2 member B [Neosynchiropus ocellatus]
MEMDTVTAKMEEKEEKVGTKVSSKVEEAEAAEYSLLRQPTEDIYSETVFEKATLQRQGQRKIRLLQAGCVILSCVSLVLLLILIIGSLSKGLRYCPDDWLQLDRSCFHFSTTRLNWDDSQRNCSALGASLAVISSSKVQSYLVDKGNFLYWIGLRNQVGRWTWVNNANLTQSFWSSGSLGGECAFLRANDKDSKSWGTAACTDRAYFICQLRM